MLKSFFVCVVLGAVGGFAYSWRRLSKSTASAIAIGLETPINSNDRAQRFERGRAVGHIKGLRLGASNFTPRLGALVGLAVWSIWKVPDGVLGVAVSPAIRPHPIVRIVA